MDLFLTLALLFCIGSVLGWALEAAYRRRAGGRCARFVNPGLLSGPCLPLYGIGTCFLFLLSRAAERFSFGGIGGKALLLCVMTLALTALELAAGVLLSRALGVRLWDYSGRRGNLFGVICPTFSLVWTALSAAYCFALDPLFEKIAEIFARHPRWYFAVSVFFAVMALDLWVTAPRRLRARAFGDQSSVSGTVTAV